MVVIMREKLEVSKFKKLIKEMYKGFPNYYYFGMVEQNIPNEEIREEVIDQKILVKLKGKHNDKQDKYILGMNGLNLVNSWKNEELANRMKNLTWVLVFLTAVLTILTGYLIFVPK